MQGASRYPHRPRALSFLQAFALLFIVLALVVPAATGTVWGQVERAGRDRTAWQPGPVEAHPHRIILRVRGDALTARAVAQELRALGYTQVRPVSFEPQPSFPDGLHFQIVTLPEDVRTTAAIDHLAALPDVLYAEPDWKVYKAQSGPIFPADPLFPAMWGLHNASLPEAYWDPVMVAGGNVPVDDADIDMPEGWAVHASSPEVVVAVIDTGAYIEHPDLAPNIWVNEAEYSGIPGVDDDGNGYVDDIHGWDFFNNDNTLFDPDERDTNGFLNDEHGTHTSGTIGAVTENGLGVAGINWDVRIMVLKFLGPDGGFTSDAILALQYAAANGAQITSNSWGGGAFSQALKDAIEASNMLFVAAAGNSGVNTDLVPHYPSSYDSPNIISVAASMQNEERANYPGWWASNYGATSVDLFAPGGYILSTIPPDPPPGPGEPPEEAYAFFYGTSMATPHVTGVAAALISMYPDLPPYPGAPGWVEGSPTIKGIILETVDVKPGYQGLVLTGGRLNAANAFRRSLPPRITEARGEPAEGTPPLEVTFTGGASDPDGTVVDVWWAFGDGSEPVHEASTTHTYAEVGDYTATFHAVDDAGLESTAVVPVRVFYPPEIEVEPLSFEVSLDWDEVRVEELTLSNTGQGPLTYAIEVRPFGNAMQAGEAAEHLELDREAPDPRRNPPQPLGRGGPDAFGYVWVDSDEPGGPTFQWRDIREVGERLELTSLDDSVEVALPFPFPFYGEEKSTVLVSTNGYLTFGTDGTDFSNDPIPDPVEPNDLIAAFWDDIDVREGGAVYAWGSAEEGVFIVQYQEVARFFSGERYTFQVILDAAGAITFQYLTMEPGRLDEATIGIEDAAGGRGLQVAFNQAYVHDGLAVAIHPTWIAAEPVEGTIDPGTSQTVELTFRAGRLPEGAYPATLVIHSDDADEPEVPVETTLHVNALAAPIIDRLEADPWAGPPPLEVRFTAEVRDVDGQVEAILWDFGDGSDPVEGTLTPVHVYETEGEYDATVTVTDDEGLVSSRSVHLLVQPLPEAVVEPPSFEAAVRAHRTRVETLTIANEGDADLEFTLTVTHDLELPPQAASPMEPWDAPDKDAVDPRPGRLHPAGFGGPDTFGYVWRDSDEGGGPVFDWVDITAVGTPLGLGDEDVAVVDLPWPFPFYGQEKGQLAIGSNGYATFGSAGSDYSNDPIPSTAQPNDLLAVWWDDLNPSSGGEVYHWYDGVNDRFIVAWHAVPRFLTDSSYTFELILYPDGRIVYQYLEMIFAPGYEDDATVGIENAAGTDGLEVLFNAAGYIHDGLAIEFYPFQWLTADPVEGVVAPGESLDVAVTFDLTPIASGTLRGRLLLETNDLLTPEIRVPVTVTVLENAPPVIDAAGVNPVQGPLGTSFQFVAAAHDPDGSIVDRYWEFGDGSDPVHAFVATHAYGAEGAYTATFHAIDNDGYASTRQVVVRVADPPAAGWTPSQLFLTAAGGQQVTADLTLTNAGPGPLIFGPGEGPMGHRVPLPGRIEGAGTPADLNARSAQGLVAPHPDPSRSSWLPDGVGDVLASWTVPAEISLPWGVGVDRREDDLIISDADMVADHRVTADGSTVEASWTTPWAGSWPADMAFDGEAVWQVNVGGDNGIYRLDPHTGEVLDAITAVPWSVSQRGLAYDPNDDTFYVGGWNEDVIYKVAGPGWDQPGQLIDSWPVAVGIAGLAYHPGADLLVVASNAQPDMIYLVDPASHEVLAQFPHPAGGDFGGAGIDFDASGNLWVASMNDRRMYLVETGLGPVASWLRWEPESGTVPAGGSAVLTVTADARSLVPGQHQGNVVLVTNDPEFPLIVVPVQLWVAQPPVITEAAADPAVGEPPLEVSFQAAVEAPETPIVSSLWDFGDGSSASGFEATHTYTAEGEYLATFTVTDALGGTARASIPIEVRPLPRAVLSPESIETTLPADGVEVHTVTLGNEEGHAPLTFRVRVRQGDAPEIALPRRVGTVTDPEATTAHGLFEPLPADLRQRIAGNVRPGAVGDVLGSWALPDEISLGWGVGFDGEKLWISDPDQNADFWTTEEAQLLGQVATSWTGDWPGDLAYDSIHGLIWQVNVGGDNGLYGLDPATGEVVASITSVPWSISQRGVAYREEDDTLYVGGWNEDVIYQIKGLSWDDPGGLIAAWSLSGAGISGLAWHPDGILWVSTNAYGDSIYGLDLEAGEIVYQFPGPAGGDFLGAGLSLGADGNLWAVTQDRRLWRIGTEMPLVEGITVDPVAGTVEPGSQAELTVSLHAAGIGLPGEDVASYLEITTNDPFRPLLTTDIRVHILPGPAITDVQVSPQVGEPPLEVTFTAQVHGPVSPIVSTWWEFGDGSAPAPGTEAVHTYGEEGVYPASFHAVDANGVEAVETVEIEVRFLPLLEVSPESFDVHLREGEQQQEELVVTNAGNGPLNYWITAAPSFAGSPEYQAYASRPHAKGEAEPQGWPVPYGSGGPDIYGYLWADSNEEQGPAFEWVEISEVGTPVILGDDASVTVPLPWGFPFYGEAKTEITISDNGYLTFVSGTQGYWANGAIPDPALPNDLIAPFWDDLDPEAGGAIYYHYDAGSDRFIVQYQEMVRWGTSDTAYTFEVILSRDGTILFQYLDLTGPVDSATVGIENATGTDGLQVVYNAAYLEEHLAVAFSLVGALLDVNPDAGHLLAGSSQNVLLTLGRPDAAPGRYRIHLHLLSDDPFRPQVTVPVDLEINGVPRVSFIVPVEGMVLQGETTVRWKVQDDDGTLIDLAYSADGGETWTPLAEGMEDTGLFVWDTSQVPVGDGYRLRIRATDPEGLVGEAISEPFTIHRLPSAEILEPQGGLVLTRPQYEIRWRAEDPEDGEDLRIDLHYLAHEDDIWRRIALNLENTGSYTWNLATVPTGDQLRLRLTARDREGGERALVSEPFSVTDAPTAAFTFTPDERIDTETPVAFTDASTDGDGTVTGWSWTFGDGGTAAEPNPVHTYGFPGIYHPSLTVVDDLGAVSAGFSIPLAVGTPDAPVVGFASADLGPGEATFDAMAEAGVAATKRGPGAVRVSAARFAGDPVEDVEPFFQTPVGFFDLNLAAFDGIDSLEVRWHFPEGVEAPEAIRLAWFDPEAGEWVEVSPQVVVVAPGGGYGGYIAFTLDQESTPALSQLTGSLFGAGTPIPNRPPEVTLEAPQAGAVWTGEETIRWTASDPDGDLLAIALSYSGDDGVTWAEIAAGEPNDGEYLWDTSQVPAGGVYRVKVEASDGELSAEAVSEPMVIVKVAGEVTHGPNPAATEATFFFNDDVAGTLVVLDAAGRRVWSAEVAAGTRYLTWDLRNLRGEPLASGLYLYVVVLDDGTRSPVQRLVIERR